MVKEICPKSEPTTIAGFILERLKEKKPLAVEKCYDTMFTLLCRA